MSKIILNTSDEAAKHVENISGWVTRDGQFFGDNESLARYAGSTHTECTECGTVRAKQSWCVPCANKKSIEKFAALERKEWDGESPLCMNDGDEYFFNMDAVNDYVEENECSIESLNLVICKPVAFPFLEEEYFLESLHEGAELPKEIDDLVNKINKAILELPPQCWEPGKYAAIV